MKLSIVVAMYGEADNVEELTERIVKSVKVPYKIIYVIDGNDGTLEKVQKLKERYPQIIYNYSPVRRGFKNAFHIGFNMVSDDTTHILTMDADLNHQPEEIHRLLGQEADIVIGSRYVDNGVVVDIPHYRRLISKVANYFMKVIFKVKARDKTSGLRLYTRKAASLMQRVKSNGFEFLFEILYLATKEGYTIKEVPITLTKRKYGVSKFNHFKTAINYLKLVITK